MIAEICVQGIASAAAACAGGARRIELCEDLRVGGVTPSAGTIAVVCGRLKVATHVLIRPRGGDFAYTDDEFQAKLHDVETAKALGARGIVLGVLNADGTVNAARTGQLIQRAAPLSVTFHRAFDATPDPWRALETLIGLGIDRVLTSGRAATARDGVGQLAALEQRANGRLVIIAGGQVTLADLPALGAAGIGEVHVGSAVQIAGITDAERVRALVRAAEGLQPA